MAFKDANRKLYTNEALFNYLDNFSSLTQKDTNDSDAAALQSIRSYQSKKTSFVLGLYGNAVGFPKLLVPIVLRAELKKNSKTEYKKPTTLSWDQSLHFNKTHGDISLLLEQYGFENRRDYISTMRQNYNPYRSMHFLNQHLKDIRAYQELSIQRGFLHRQTGNRL